MSDHPVILFDGVCNFCNGLVNFIIRHDKNKKLRFAALQSQAGKALLEKYQLQKKDFDSFVLIENGKVFSKSSAALYVLHKLPWYWQELRMFWIIPAFMRNAIYDFVARNRYNWFGKKEECMVPGEDVRERFL